MRTSQLLVRYLRPHRGRVALLAVLLFAWTGLPLVGPQITRAFVDEATSTGRNATLVRLALLYLAVGVVTEIVSVWTKYTSEQVGWSSTNDLRADLAEHALSLDMSFHNSTTPGELIERIDGDVTALSNFFSQFVLSIIGSVMFGAGILALTFREHAGVGLVLTVFSVVSLTAMARLRRSAVPAATAQRESSARLYGFLEERLQGVDDIRALGAGPHVMRGFARASRTWLNGLVTAERKGMRIWTSSVLFFGSSIVLTTGMGAWLHSRGALTTGTVFMLVQYVTMLDEPLSSIAAQLKDFQKAGAGLERVRGLMAESSSLRDGTERPSGAAVAFEHVSFGYGRPEPVLKDVSFELPPGSVAGIVGRTGSGKTTIARLLVRLYDAEQGRITLGGTDVREWRLADLRRRVGIVTQDVQLFEGTLRDNLSLFDPDVSDDRILDALTTLGLSGWFRQLPEGLDTQLASGGGGLSAGEAQLLAFARVFLRDPAVVVLDEATSRLDPLTQSRIEDATNRLLDGRTAIVIAHRLATVARADVICVMEDGRIVEAGPRAQLAADPTSRFSNLLRTGTEEEALV